MDGHVIQEHALHLGVAHPVDLQAQRSNEGRCPRVNDQYVFCTRSQGAHSQHTRRFCLQCLAYAATLYDNFHKNTQTPTEQEPGTILVENCQYGTETLLATAHTWNRRSRLSRPAVSSSWPLGWNSTERTTDALGSALLASASGVTCEQQQRSINAWVSAASAQAVERCSTREWSLSWQ